MVVLLDGPGSCEAKVGERIVVRLAETPSTGYQWQVEDLPDGLALEDTRFEPPTSDAPGAGGHRVIDLRATEPGTHRLSLGHRRAWESTATESAVVLVHASSGARQPRTGGG